MFQTQQITTEVFPSEMGEGEIPWWVWLLAAILGLLLLAIITYCLYKVSIAYWYITILSPLAKSCNILNNLQRKAILGQSLPGPTFCHFLLIL